MRLKDLVVCLGVAALAACASQHPSTPAAPPLRVAVPRNSPPYAFRQKGGLVGLEIDGRPIDFNMTKWTVLAGGRPVGRVTSAIHSPRLKANIGYAMLPIIHTDLGTELTVDHPDGPRTATVVKKPFIDPGKEIPKA